MTSYINSKEGFPISVRAFSALSHRSRWILFALHLFFSFFSLITFKYSRLFRLNLIPFERTFLENWIFTLLLNEKIFTIYIYTFFESYPLFFFAIYLMNRSLVHKFSTLTSIRKKRNDQKCRCTTFKIREREREQWCIILVWNASRLARDVEEAINPGVSRAKIRGSISGSKKSMNHRLRRGRALSELAAILGQFKFKFTGARLGF